MRSVFKYCEFVDRYFPDRNMQRDYMAKDVNCKASSTMEMISIAHHLYVLKFAGVKGSFAEFGCFKGFSTAKLSYACSLLKIPMLVFDLFEGLPPSSSDFYKAGDFAGSLDEVRDNVTSFGCIDSVTFYKGFFSNSLKRVAIPPLMTIWMDVDLISSATDVMAVADRLDRQGAIFTHECTADHFQDGKIYAGPPNSGNVVPPIIAALEHLGATVAGRHLVQQTGSFWRRDEGIPVASADAVFRLARSI